MWDIDFGALFWFGAMIALIISVVVMAALKIAGLLLISWWWIVAAIPAFFSVFLVRCYLREHITWR